MVTLHLALIFYPERKSEKQACPVNDFQPSTIIFMAQLTDVGHQIVLTPIFEPVHC